MSELLRTVPSHLHAIPIYQPGKSADEIKRQYGLSAVVKLASNENPLGPGAKVQAALTAHCADISRYPEDAAPDLINQICQLEQLDAEQVVLGAGSSAVLEFISRIFLDANAELIIPEYAFILYKILAMAANAKVRSIANTEQWQPDFAAMLAAINDHTRLIIVANPNNPTGSWVPYPVLADFIQQVPSHVMVVVDEAYHEYMTNVHGYQSVSCLVASTPNLIVCRTFSKIYALAGLRLGYCLAHPEVAQLLKRIKKPFAVSSMALVAGATALADTAHQAKSREVNQAGQSQLLKAFSQLNIKVLNATANFITIHLGQQALAVAERLLEQGVIVRPLVPYGMQDYLRITVGLAAENELFIQRFTACLETL